MIKLEWYLKSLFVAIWGLAIAFRVVDIKGVMAQDSTLFIHYVISPIQVDILGILMSVGIVSGAFLWIGRKSNAWLLLCIAIIVSKFVIVVADACVGDLPYADILFVSSATFALPLVMIIFLIRSRSLVYQAQSSAP